jgi:hypothetical protein
LQANSTVSQMGGAVAYVFTDSSGLPNYAQPQVGDFARGIDAVTAIFMADSIANDYLLSPSLGASTDWVVDFPTQRFYRDPIYASYTGPGSPSIFAAAVYDREEGAALPATQERISLSYDVNVISFLTNTAPSAPSGVFGSLLNTNIAPSAESGTMRLDAGRHRLATDTSGFYFPLMGFGGGNLFGYAVTGFMAYNIINANAQPGRLANYGATFRHRMTACINGGFVDNFIICKR